MKSAAIIVYEPLTNGKVAITMDQLYYFSKVIQRLEDLIKNEDVRNYIGERAFTAIESILKDENK